jgi:hypothetical protein
MLKRVLEEDSHGEFGTLIQDAKRVRTPTQSRGRGTQRGDATVIDLDTLG